MDRHRGFPCLRLESERLSVAVLPELGCKVASVFDKAKGFEYLSQPADGRYRVPEPGAPFSRYDTSGLDEMLPTIDACELSSGGRTYALPDHGEAWYGKWETSRSGDALLSRIDLRSMPFRFERRLSLADGNRLRFAYRLENLSNAELPYLWALHSLNVITPGTRVLFPEEHPEVVAVQDSGFMGSAGGAFAYPDAAAGGRRFDLSRPGALPAGMTGKFYLAKPLRTGAVRIQYPEIGSEWALEYDPARVPELGVWINTGGFKSERNLAVEPATGFYDSLKAAIDLGRVRYLKAGAAAEWEIGVAIRDTVL